MKLSYKASGSQDTYSVLADESDRVTTLELMDPAWERQVQTEALVRAASAVSFARGNVVVSLGFVITVTYSTLANALAGVEAFAVAFDAATDFKLEQGATVLFFPNAVCGAYKPTLSGVTVRHALKFVSQQISKQEA